MRGDRDLRAHFLDALARDPRRDDADAIGGAGDHMPPGIDDKRMTIGGARLAADLMQASLGWRAKISLRLDGAGSAQNLPMVLAGQ